MDRKNICDLLPSSLFEEIFITNELPNSTFIKTGIEISDNSSVASVSTADGIQFTKLVVPPMQQMNCVNPVESPLMWMTTLQNLHSDFCLSSLKCQLPEILKTRHGSAMCSQLINEITDEYFNELFNILLSHWSDLMCNSFAHTFCIKFFQFSNKNQKICILNSIKNSFSLLNITFFGSRSVQDIIELIADDFDLSSIILDSVSSYNDILNLCYNTFGCHVIKKIIQCIEEERRTKLNSVLLANFQSLATHMNGVLIIKKFLRSSKIEVNKAQIIKIIAKEFLKLSQNQYGNYIVQEFIECMINTKSSMLENLLKKYFVKLATHRISLHVIEKFLLVAKERNILQIFQRLRQEEDFDMLAQNKYGNIILAKMITCIQSDRM